MTDVPIATSLAYLVRILSQTLMAAVYGVLLNQELAAGIANHRGVTLRMLNELNNAATAHRLPVTQLPMMRQILYQGYRVIMVAALVLMTGALVVILLLLIRTHRRKAAGVAPQAVVSSKQESAH